MRLVSPSITTVAAGVIIWPMAIAKSVAEKIPTVAIDCSAAYMGLPPNPPSIPLVRILKQWFLFFQLSRTLILG